MVPNRITIRLLDLAVLLYHLRLSAQHPTVGYNDAEKSLIHITSKLNKTIEVDKEDIERLLYAANLMNEAGSWSHYLGTKFPDWLKQLFGSKFDTTYNVFKDR
jgi:hypothetical protein